MLSGDNGILQKTTDAKILTEKASGLEQIKIGVLGSFDKTSSLNILSLNNNLKNISGLKYKGNNLSESNKIESLPATVELNGNLYKINIDGSVENKNPIIIPDGLTIGSSVTYEPTGGTYTWDYEYATSTRSGNQELDSTSTGHDRITNWKVFKIDEDEGKIQLIPSNYDGNRTRVLFQGAQGYNNAVQLLDEACSALYAYPLKGITARSIDLEDINPLIDPDILTTAKNNNNFNIQASNAYEKGKSFYPRIYEEENKSVINGNEKTGGLGQSTPGSKKYNRDEATSLTSGQTEYTNSQVGFNLAKVNIQPYNTYYEGISWNNSNNFLDSLQESGVASTYASMLNISKYWIASRYVNASNYDCKFGIYQISGGTLDYYVMFGPGSDLDHYDQTWLLPVTTLDVSLLEKDGQNYKVNL